MRRGFAAVLVSCGVCVSTGAAAQVQVITANAYLGRTDVQLGQQFILTVEVSGTQRLDANPVLPDVGGFATILGSGTTTSTRIVNGRRSVSVLIQYRMQATALGEHEIGSVTVAADGVEVSTMPVPLTVLDAPPPQTPAAPRPGSVEQSDGEIGPEDLFLTAEVSKRQVLQNEPIIVEYRIFTRVNVTSYSLTDLPPAAGFWVEEFELPPQPEAEQIVRNGERYVTALIRKVAMFPTSAGTKRVEPLRIEARVQVQRQRGRDIFRGLLDPSSMFASEIPTAVASPAIEVEVLPLPAAGRPARFSGMVGDLSVTGRLDRDSVSANEAVTMTVEVSGSGNLKGIAPPQIDLPPTVEAFPPKASDRLRITDRGVTGTRTYEYVLIPRAPGSLTIPAIDVSYFDPARRDYRVASSEPLALTVAGRVSEGALSGSRARGEVEALRTDIRFIEIDTPRFERSDGSPLTRPWFWLVLLGPLGLVGGAVGLRRHRDRLSGDVALARSRRAARVARKRLASARELARGGGDARAFYAETGRALTGFVADRLNVSAAGIIRDELRSALEGRGGSEEAISEYLACVDMCDRQRFSPADSDLDEREAFVARVEAAMAALDRDLGQ